MQLINRLFDSRFWALAVKEISQILRNKQLLFLLIFTPTVYMMIVGFSLNSDVKNIPLRFVDYSNTPASRELVSVLTESGIFSNKGYSTRQQPLSQETLSQQIQRGEITAGLVIPPEFNRDLRQGLTAQIQVLIDAVDANTAALTSAYITEIVSHYSQQLGTNSSPARVEPQVTILYNPGLISYWFIVPAVLGLVLSLNSSTAATNSVIAEKVNGTQEQLLMTPASAWEILLAKVMPLFILMMGDIIMALGMARIIFDLPLRGNFLLFLALAGLYIFVGIGLGMLIGTITHGHLQATLSSFFINIPVALLAGAIAPLESMPTLFKYLSLLDPLRYYVEIMRGLLLKGVGLSVLWPNVLALGIFATVLLTISVKRFRNQLI